MEAVASQRASRLEPNGNTSPNGMDSAVLHFAIRRKLICNLSLASLSPDTFPNLSPLWEN